VAYIRTLSEAGPIPEKEDYGASYRAANFTREMLKDQVVELDKKLLAEEAGMFEREARFIFDRLLDAGDGDAAQAIVRGIESGLLDNPWGTHPSVACKAMGVRDAQGAVRYYDTGNVPFPGDIKDWHRHKVAARSAKEGREVDYDNVVQDILSVNEGALLKMCEV